MRYARLNSKRINTSIHRIHKHITQFRGAIKNQYRDNISIKSKETPY